MEERKVFIVSKGFVTLRAAGKGSRGPHSAGINKPIPIPIPIPIPVPTPVPNSVRPERAFRYGEMFGASSQFHPDEEALAELGRKMHAVRPNGANHKNHFGYLPAGYTYLGQFITHDITFDKTEEVVEAELNSDQIRRGRSPSLELDCLYGMGPQSETSRHLYEPDSLRFKIGLTTPTFLGNATGYFPNDLPRDSSNPAAPRRALIADPRNDRNLAIAQTHLAFLKFHNAVVDFLAAKGMLGKELFDAARKKVIQHYQWIVLNDYLEKLLDPAVLKYLKNEKEPKYFKLGQGEELFLPIEFAFGAYRFGHSLVRDAYEWNRVFNSSNKIDQTNSIQSLKAAPLHKLFMLTGGNGNLEGALTLPTSWIIDWTRFYNFNRTLEITQDHFNRASRIDTSLSPALGNLPGFPAYSQAHSPSVAVLDLQLGALLNMLTGQEVAERMEIAALSPVMIAQGPHKAILQAHGLDEQTPLWYYTLKEAETTQQGKRLGQLGSWIVGDTLVALIKASEFSILKEVDWRPDLGRTRGTFNMTDLLLFVNDLNPLGNGEAVQASPQQAVGQVKPKFSQPLENGKVSQASAQQAGEQKKPKPSRPRPKK